ncbi:MAG: hypothetical protein QM651_13645 [Rhodoblastus sp.]
MQTFEQLIAEAAHKRASVRIEPERDGHTGNLVFVAHLHGQPGKATRYLLTGTVVTPLERAQHNGPTE